MSRKLIKFLSWNLKGYKKTIDGLKTNKLLDKDINEQFQKYDIIFLQETHLEKEIASSIHFSNFAPGIHFVRNKREKA